MSIILGRRPSKSWARGDERSEEGLRRERPQRLEGEGGPDVLGLSATDMRVEISRDTGVKEVIVKDNSKT